MWDGHPTDSAKGKGQLANTPQIAHHWVIGYDTILSICIVIVFFIFFICLLLVYTVYIIEFIYYDYISPI